MLREMARVRQNDPAVRRRWFRDDYFDIFTWENARGCIVSFQLCYDLPTYERVLSWRHAGGYTHHRVADGERSPIKNMTPIMSPDGLLPLNTVLTEFDRRAVGLETDLRAFLRERLLEYGAGAASEIDKPVSEA
jgi:hypothetical protein